MSSKRRPARKPIKRQRRGLSFWRIWRAWTVWAFLAAVLVAATR